ncbi:S-adenosyl-L-methionine-dependent methyltransferase [Hyaloscypha variabilis]|uniref:S-adenosyl-L-methionine-dependent methyltransferase n=1 Tax=Hyaloscypha variabilis (strain UAMH 11265 / GT02V1 / F) TaxID=1149755 RepID=A0A2J6RLK9_HYAVF|nr:S-adenosyl-L-methionine-dependent methyltransferase [Hyaloscypha variabilis F]
MAEEPPTPAAATVQAVEVDTDEADSSYGDEVSYTTSLSSGIRNHTYENGRRYHAFRAGSYYAPNDEAENDRLDMHHHLATLLLKGKLHVAPIGTNPQRILDLGCGTGIWAIDIGDEYPSAQVVGVDLSPTQPSMVPPNVQFEVDDVEGEWTYNTPFDLIHSRFMVASIKNWPKLVNQVYTHLKPGGWCEFKDWDFTLHSVDNSLPPDSHLIKHHQLLYQALGKIGLDWDTGRNLKRWVEEAGFENVEEQVLVVPIGTWPKDKHYKEIGAWHYVIKSEGLEAISLRLFTNVLGWTPEEVLVFLAKVRAELKDKNIHAQYNYTVVIGQKKQ